MEFLPGAMAVIFDEIGARARQVSVEIACSWQKKGSCMGAGIAETTIPVPRWHGRR